MTDFNAEQVMGSKTCCTCGEVKFVLEFQKKVFFDDGSQRYTSRCKVCMSKYTKSRYAADPDKFRKSANDRREFHPEYRTYCKKKSKAYHLKNKAKANKISRSRYLRHKDEVCAHQRKVREDNPEVCRAKSRERYAKNPEYFRAHSTEARAARLLRVPPWSDTDKINLVYKKCVEFSELYNINFHVDHVDPLQGDEVSGLHVWENLQLLDASLNKGKNNGFYPNGYPYVNYL